MKRALAERAKQQKQEAAANFMQQQQNNGKAPGPGSNHLIVGGTPLMSTLGSGGANTNNAMHSSPSVMHPHHTIHNTNISQQHQQPQDVQSSTQSDSSNRKMKVELTGQPPRKIPRIKSSTNDSPRTPTAGIKSNSSGSNTTSAKKSKQNGVPNASKNATGSIVKPSLSSTTNPKKRSRPSSSGGGRSSSTPSALRTPLPLPNGGEDDEEENDAKNTRFYLKHQNSALASELYRYKHAIRVLEEERKVRRDECRQIHDALMNMVSYWDGMEGILAETFGGRSSASVSISFFISSICEECK